MQGSIMACDGVRRVRKLLCATVDGYFLLAILCIIQKRGKIYSRARYTDVLFMLWSIFCTYAVTCGCEPQPGAFVPTVKCTSFLDASAVPIWSKAHYSIGISK